MKLKISFLAASLVGLTFAGCSVQVANESLSQTQAVSAHRYTMVINRATNRMTVYSVATHQPVAGWVAVPVITGAGYATPRGTFHVEFKEKCPPWYHPELGQAGPCAANNPLGRRWIQFNTASYGVHGNSDESLFNLPDNERRLSHGCVRMRNADVERLYEFVGVGDKIEIY